ncbi:amino acid transporter [Xylariales sp. PMI_506]|nr:amino acid transporter [Xylariales sp. PMI_506]
MTDVEKTVSTDAWSDDLELEASGYQQTMPRQFSAWSLSSLSFVLSSSWLAVGSSIGISQSEASAAGTLWSIPISGVMTLAVSAGMAELESAYPVAGAQYYWSFMVSSEKHRAVASFFSGWMSVIGWWLGGGAATNFVSSIILDIVIAWHPDYIVQAWHQYLIYCGLFWLAISINILAYRFIPLISSVLFYLSLATFLSTIIVLFVVARDNHSSTSYIFTDITNGSGWTSNGWAFMFAIGNGEYYYLGVDQECDQGYYPLGMGIITAFLFAIALTYSITDLEAVFSTATGLPLYEIYHQGTKSDIAASILVALFAFAFFGCLVSGNTTCSRTLWAVSRDGALPFASVWAKVHPRFKVPVNALLLTGVCVTLYGLILLGSSTTFKAMVNMVIIFMQTSWGEPVNALSIVWVFFLYIMYCFPTSLPVTPQNLSYVAVVTTGLHAFIIILWFTTKRNVFTGPHVDLEMLKQRRKVALRDGLPPIQTIENDPERSESFTDTKPSALYGSKPGG